MQVDRRQKTQLSAWRLLTPDRIAERTSKLANSRVVSDVYFGKSSSGRPIPCLVLGEAKITEMLSATLSPSKPTVMLTGGTFGSESSETESLMQVLEMLTGRGTCEELLHQINVVVMPCVNPDGRSGAIEHWKKHPLSAALGCQYNDAGFLLNRDFFYLLQPETQFVHQVFTTYRPSVVLDLHEDIYGLGVDRKEVCWCPPFKRPIHPMVSAEVLVGIDLLGTAIADVWIREGFDCLHDRSGERGLLSLARYGRLHLDFCLHNTIALITESARTPGVQSWEDRVNQKVSASLSVFEKVAEEAARFLQLVRKAGNYPREDKSYFIPEENPPDELRFLLQVLSLHGVKYEPTSNPEQGYSVSFDQRDDKLAHLLLCGVDAMGPLTSALGVRGIRVLSSESLAPRTPAGSRLGKSTSNRDLTELDGGADVHDYPIQESHIGLIREAFDMLRAGRKVRLFQSFDGRAASSWVVASVPRVALFSGPGVLERHAESLAWTRYALKEMNIDYTIITEEDIRAHVLREIDLLVITGGDAQEIIDGHDRHTCFDRTPWQERAESPGLGKLGLESIRTFMIRGGLYLGIGTGGGSLLCHPYSPILDVEEIQHSLGRGRLRVRVCDSAHPVHGGLAGEETGNSDSFWAFYYSNLDTGIKGGPIYRAGKSAEVLALFEMESIQVDADEGIGALRESGMRQIPAILSQRVGDGLAIILAFEPAFLGIAKNTAKVLANAALYAAARR